MNLLVPFACASAGVLWVAAGTISWRRRAAERRLGELAAIDAGRSWTLRSARYRLVGRPDELRQRADGSLVPVELKHSARPRRGAYASHVAQVAAYCLLAEEVIGRSPPFGVLRYRDAEVVVRWDRAARDRVLELLTEVNGPYDGRADPAPAKCASCRWSRRCDASLAPT